MYVLYRLDIYKAYLGPNYGIDWLTQNVQKNWMQRRCDFNADFSIISKWVTFEVVIIYPDSASTYVSVDTKPRIKHSQII